MKSYLNTIFSIFLLILFTILCVSLSACSKDKSDSQDQEAAAENNEMDIEYFISSLPPELDIDSINTNNVSFDLNINNRTELNQEYADLIFRDTNEDGYINNMDQAELSFSDVYEALNYTDEYFNQFYRKDIRYGFFQEIDINNSGTFEEFEFELLSLKRAKNQQDFQARLDELVNMNLLSYVQKKRAEFNAFSYWGLTDLANESISETAEIADQSANEIVFMQVKSLLAQGNNEEAYEKISDYTLAKYSGRRILDNLLNMTFVSDIHSSKDALIIINNHIYLLFPAGFAHRTFLLKLQNRILNDVYAEQLYLEMMLEEEPDSSDEVQQQIDLRIEYFNKMDGAISQITKLDFYTSYVTIKMRNLTEDMQAFLDENDVQSIPNYSYALDIIRSYRHVRGLDKKEIPYIIAGYLKLFINNAKPPEESDFEFSPDTMIDKGYGVCTDQSLFFAIAMRDLDMPAPQLYYWQREFYWGHVYAIVQNIDDTFLIFDNYGLQNQVFSSLNNALEEEMNRAVKYRYSIDIREGGNSNKEWIPIENDEADFIATTDNQYTIEFSEMTTIMENEQENY